MMQRSLCVFRASPSLRYAISHPFLSKAPHKVRSGPHNNGMMKAPIFFPICRSTEICLDGLKGSTYLHSNSEAAANLNVVPQRLASLGKKLNESVCPPNAVSLRNSIHSSSQKEFETTERNARSMNFDRGRIEGDRRYDMGGSQLPPYNVEHNAQRNTRSMDFVRGIIKGDARNNMGDSQLTQYGIENNADVVHIKLMRNNTFVTVTDSKGNKKIGASSGMLSEMKGGPKLSKYAAEATAEHVGRLARNMGLKTFVVRVNGFTHFKKKRQAIVSFKEGYTNSKIGPSPIVFIEDTTRKAHNGCRLPKKRRV